MIQPYSVQAFLPFKGPGGVFTEPPPPLKSQELLKVVQWNIAHL